MLIRTAEKSDSMGIAKVQVDAWRNTYRGIVPDDYLNSLTSENKKCYWENFIAEKENQSVIVAETDEKQIVGFAAAGQNADVEKQFAGELHKLYLLENRQRRGIGTFLFRAAVQSLVRRQITSMIVWVLADNPYRVFYEKFGGEYVSERHIEIGGASLLDVAYGWRDLRIV